MFFTKFHRVLILIFFTLPLYAKTLPEQLKYILNQDLDFTTPGAVLLVSGPQLGTIVVSAGVANKTDQQPMAANNNFRIASMSKTFLAVTILKLMEQGKINIDSKISSLLPDSIVNINHIPNGKELTVRDLMQMRSGVPNYVEFDTYETLIDRMYGKRWTPDLCIKLIYDKKPDFAPGKGFKYSNTNYLLLQLIVEKLMVKPYSEVIRSEILDPLQLKNTYIEVAETNDKRYLLTHGYALGNRDQLIDITYYNDGFGLADTGIISTVNDINTFVQALLKNKILLSSKSLDMMLSMKDDYGLGIYRQEIDNEWAYTHNGATSGFQGEYYYFPKEQITIVLLTNSFDTDIIQRVVSDVFKLVKDMKPENIQDTKPVPMHAQ